MRPKSRGQAMASAGQGAFSTPPAPLARPDTSHKTKVDAPSPSPPPADRTIKREDTIGQFAYGPATQTTVVTTTTTTTTKFPPLMLRAPKHLHDLDPKSYPLASTPTPQSIRKLSFQLDGKRTVFEEAEDPVVAVERLNEQDAALSRSYGSLCSVSQTYSGSDVPALSRSLASHNITSQHPTLSPSRIAGTKRPASPVSISEAAHLAAGERPRKRRHIDHASESNSQDPSSSQSQPSRTRLRTLQMSTPITPHMATANSAQVQQTPDWESGDTSSLIALENTVSQTNTSEGTVHDEEAQIPSPRSEDGRIDLNPNEDDPEDGDTLDSNLHTSWRHLEIGPAITPIVDDEAQEAQSRSDTPISRPPRDQSRPQPYALDTTAPQDASLPSPSLSPVTAAANLLQRRNYFDQARTNAQQLSQDQTQETQAQKPNEFVMPRPRTQRRSLPILASFDSSTHADETNGDRSLMCIPQMVDDFEAMPEEMKKYVVYQFLRRCSRPVLHFVADAVNPSLKCDFLKNLPLELSEAILGHLDVKSLCAAAQVSRRWRQQVDMSEKVWKRLFFADGYSLQEGELARAIREGWGWQTVSELGGAEQDLSMQRPGSADKHIDIQMSPDLSVAQGTRSRRRGKAKSKSGSRNLRKRKQGFSSASQEDDESLLSMAAAHDGPYAAATAAAAAISLPRNDLHLWKSIYMRHHIIQQTWTREEVAPRHLAFRAHQRHVVTCLQFDSEKILTGSDDANINVYDTQTGVLRAKLEGHEGGVWALQYEGNVLVSGSTDRSVRVWDIERGVCTHTFQGHTSTVRCLQILKPTRVGTSVDGRAIMMPKYPLIITGSRDSNLRVWKLPKPGDTPFHQAGPAADEATESPYFVRALTGHHHSVRAIAAHADTLVSGSYDCTVRVWRISTGETVFRLQGHTQKVYSVVLDHKRNRCISGSMDNVVKVWSLETGMALFNLEGHSSLVGLLDLQQDRLVSAAADSTLRIWDPETGQCRSTLMAHTGAITCFQHDGQKVISGSDRTLKMWNIATGEFVRDLLTDLSNVWQVKFNDRRCVAAVQRNNFTFIEVLDFGAARDGVPETKRGRRILVDVDGHEMSETGEVAEAGGAEGN